MLTNYREYTTVDKAGWEAGPWSNEPDKVQWIDERTGLDCLIVRGPLGALCGYVGVDETHPLHGISYSQECDFLKTKLAERLQQPMGEQPSFRLLIGALCGSDPEPSPGSVFMVHGGLTFSDKCCESKEESKGICHVPAEGRSHNVWWFGFDCAHCDDATPGSDHRISYPVSGIYRDMEYVRKQVESLAQQIKAVA